MQAVILPGLDQQNSLHPGAKAFYAIMSTEF